MRIYLILQVLIEIAPTFFKPKDMKDLNEDTVFSKRIKEIYYSSTESPINASEGIKLCQQELNSLRKQVVKKRFATLHSEIHFFKSTKHEPLKYLIYFTELKNIHLKMPKGDLCRKKRFILKRLSKLNQFFELNFHFCRYIEQRCTHLDLYYFTREHANEFSYLDGLPYFRDKEFSTSHDLLYAKFKAYTNLAYYLEKWLNRLKISSFEEIPKSKLRWTSSKAALTELTYALYHGGVVNNGNSDIKEIANALERTFNYPIGDVYRTYTEIRGRKKRRSKFLDELSTSLISGMDRLEE